MTKPRTFTRRYWTDADRLTQAYILLTAAAEIVNNVAIARDRDWGDIYTDITTQAGIARRLSWDLHQLDKIDRTDPNR